jgi:subtilisin family serine protease/predicted small lipoprotein YifL
MRRFLLASFALLTLASSLAVAGRAPQEFPPAALALALQRRPVHPMATPEGAVPVTVRLRPGEDASALGLLEVAPGIGARWVAPGGLPEALETLQDRRPWAMPPLRLLGDVSGERWTRARAAHAKGRKGKGVVVGVLDTGLDLAHPDLRVSDQGGSRVAWLLDLANRPIGLHPELEQRFGCLQPQAPCAVLSSEDIDRLLTDGIDGIVSPSDSVGHGTHVAGIAAGNGAGSPGKKYAGVAPDSTLIAVRVTRSAAGQSVTDADLLNAVRFVFDRADALGLPAVVNVSLGGDYGPHDGTSTLEEGLAAFVGPGRPGRAIVVAAGNSGGILTDQQGQTFGPHTESRTLARSTTRLVLTMPAARRQARGTAYVWATFQPGDDLRVGLEWNGERVIQPLARGEQGALDEEDGRPYLGVIHGVVSDSSPLSARTNGAIVIADGVFNPGDRLAITLEGDGTAQLWVQGTGDAEFGSPTGGMLFLNPLKQGTVNVPATHPDLLAVGCTLNRLDWPTLAGPQLLVTQVGALQNPPPDTVCYFSGAGPNALGVLKPEIAAPGGFVAAAMSEQASPDKNLASMFSSPPGRCGTIKDCYVVDETHAVSSGTSMSAPQVTGAIALLFEQRPSLTQPELVALLQAGARAFEGLVPSEAQSGPGALDIDASLELLAPTVERAPTPPLAARSWLHFSSEFLRPDGQWPVTGTLLLRDQDRHPADGFDPTRLRLEVGGARVLRPLSRVGAGLWQFSLAAPPGTGGARMKARVLLGDEVLAERDLPIAPDVWNIHGAPEARGGCSR